MKNTLQKIGKFLKENYLLIPIVAAAAIGGGLAIAAGASVMGVVGAAVVVTTAATIGGTVLGLIGTGIGAVAGFAGGVAKVVDDVEKEAKAKLLNPNAEPEPAKKNEKGLGQQTFSTAQVWGGVFFTLGFLAAGYGGQKLSEKWFTPKKADFNKVAFKAVETKPAVATYELKALPAPRM